jgi:hypothetical protein
MKEYYCNTRDDFKIAEILLTNALKLSIRNFETTNFRKYRYSFFEIRILFLLGLVEEKTQDAIISTDIFLFVLEYMLNSPIIDIETQKLVLKIYANISYNYHKIDRHDLALKFANKGIDYAVKNSNMHCLYLLFARKGVAEFFLEHTNYIDTLQKSIQLLEINNQIELSKLYKDIVHDKYNIVL